MIICTLKRLTLQDCIDLHKEGIAVVYKGGRMVSFEILKKNDNKKCLGHIAGGPKH